jgi:hypothetical protein
MYALGDRIRVRHDCRWEDQRGFIGTVVSLDDDQIWVDVDSYSIEGTRYREPRFFYLENEIDVIDGGHHKMLAPEFDLDDMELAEIIMEELK